MTLIITRKHTQDLDLFINVLQNVFQTGVFHFFFLFSMWFPQSYGKCKPSERNGHATHLRGLARPSTHLYSFAITRGVAAAENLVPRACVWQTVGKRNGSGRFKNRNQEFLVPV